VERRKVFRISISRDGKTWIDDAARDSDTYWQIARDAKDSSQINKRIERITNLELGKVLVAFRNGLPDRDHYTAEQNPTI